GPGSEQRAQLAGRFALFDLAAALDLKSGAFLDMVAAMQSLDLVVTSDTAVAHLAGALGVPVWVALSAAPDWRWLRERDDSPCSPSMRLCRQRKLGVWSDVFQAIAAALAGIGKPPARQ